MARMRPEGRGGTRRERRVFTDDFRASVVRLVLDEGKTIASVSRDLDLTESAVRVWVERARADQTGGKTGLTTEERAELARLRRENRELRMEREILKKAVLPSSRRRTRKVRVHPHGGGVVPRFHALQCLGSVTLRLLRLVSSP